MRKGIFRREKNKRLEDSGLKSDNVEEIELVDLFNLMRPPFRVPE